ncbi:MAG TPA: permease prefix domain 1-containing protein, partial [Tepidisphaeraceae bacterium]|nr:permease prefix domain 1-containing protein [Tepidisphaeraceae bacterium]
MFDLEDNIRAWRQAVTELFARHVECVDELESHIREEFDRLIASGISPQDAWQTALGRLGDPRKIADDLATLDRSAWLPAWVAWIVLALSLVGVLWSLTTRGTRPLLASHVLFVCCGYLSALALGLLGTWVALTHAVGSGSTQRNVAFRKAGGHLARTAVLTTGVAVLLGAIWSHANLGHWWAWQPVEIGGACVLTWIGVVAYVFGSRRTDGPMMMVTAITGSLVVSVSWFGPQLLKPAHSYGSPSTLFGGLLGCFLLIEILAV